MRRALFLSIAFARCVRQGCSQKAVSFAFLRQSPSCFPIDCPFSKYEGGCAGGQKTHARLFLCSRPGMCLRLIQRCSPFFIISLSAQKEGDATGSKKHCASSFSSSSVSVVVAVAVAIAVAVAVAVAVGITCMHLHQSLCIYIHFRCFTGIPSVNGTMPNAHLVLKYLIYPSN